MLAKTNNVQSTLLRHSSQNLTQLIELDQTRSKAICVDGLDSIELYSLAFCKSIVLGYRIRTLPSDTVPAKQPHLHRIGTHFLEFKTVLDHILEFDSIFFSTFAWKTFDYAKVRQGSIRFGMVAWKKG